MKLKRGAYTLEGKILCDACYFRNISERNITFTESEGHRICVDDVRLRFGVEDTARIWSMRCPDCGILIEYELSG